MPLGASGQNHLAGTSHGLHYALQRFCHTRGSCALVSDSVFCGMQLSSHVDLLQLMYAARASSFIAAHWVLQWMGSCLVLFTAGTQESHTWHAKLCLSRLEEAGSAATIFLFASIPSQMMGKGGREGAAACLFAGLHQHHWRVAVSVWRTRRHL